MISINEIVKPGDDPNVDQLNNLRILNYKLNCVRQFFGKPLTITSGFRTVPEQMEIYLKLGKKPPLGSMHLFGAAADVADSDGILKKWILDNLEFMENQFLFMEDFDATPTWVHLQIYSYGSWAPGKTHFFLP